MCVGGTHVTVINKNGSPFFLLLLLLLSRASNCHQGRQQLLPMGKCYIDDRTRTRLQTAQAQAVRRKIARIQQLHRGMSCVAVVVRHRCIPDADARVSGSSRWRRGRSYKRVPCAPKERSTNRNEITIALYRCPRIRCFGCSLARQCPRLQSSHH